MIFGFVRHVLAVAELRVRQGVAARLAWIVPLGALAGIAAAQWAPGTDDVARAAAADRVALGTVGGMAVLAALVSAATTIPADLRSGAAYRLLASPVSRLAVVVGGVLGHGLLATVLLVGGMGAALLGLDVGGLGAGAREPARTFFAANPGETVSVTRESPVADVTLQLPRGAAPANELVLRLSPRGVNEGGELARTGMVSLSLRQPGGAMETVDVGFAPGRPFTARLPADELDPRLPTILTIHRPTGSWGLHFPAGSIEAGGPTELFVQTASKAAICLIPLLFLAAAAGALGAARFNAPTALGLGAALLLAVAGHDVLRDGAEYIVRAADDARVYAAEGHYEGDGHDHGDHEHAPIAISPLQESLAKAALVGLDVVPGLDVFDRSRDLLDRRSVTLAQCRTSALAALPGVALLLALSWLLLARRDLLPT